MWARLDDALPDHPKLLAAGELVGGANRVGVALALYVVGLAWASRYLTDGVIPRAAVRTFTQVDHPLLVAEALVTSGLWHQHGDGFLVHDFNDFNPSAALVKRKRRRDRDRKRHELNEKQRPKKP